MPSGLLLLHPYIPLMVTFSCLKFVCMCRFDWSDSFGSILRSYHRFRNKLFAKYLHITSVIYLKLTRVPFWEVLFRVKFCIIIIYIYMLLNMYLELETAGSFTFIFHVVGWLFRFQEFAVLGSLWRRINWRWCEEYQRSLVFDNVESLSEPPPYR